MPKVKTPVVTHQFVKVKQKNREFIVTKLNASALVSISYASVRGQDDEEGAVQRILNPRRIASLRDFTLSGGDYASCVVLNWVSQQNSMAETSGSVSIPIVPRAAQIIDGQHRIEGLREAIKAESWVAAIEIPVAIYKYLDTRACADIFLSINTEQKPAPRSLVFDLYGVASEVVVDVPALRARDIATSLNESADSPYNDLIRFPGAAKRKFGVDLSTVVSAIKPLVEDKGVFESVGIRELEMQTRVLFNYLGVLRDWYGTKWSEKDNAFLSAAGFSGAVEFLKNKLIPYCNTKRSYKADVIRQAMNLQKHSLVTRGELKGLQGRAAMRTVADSLTERFLPVAEIEEAIEI
jgi:DGQHR domain-containing protein